MSFKISPISPDRVYANDDPLFFGGTIEPFYPSCVDEPVKEIMIDVIEFVVLVLYVQNHITPYLRWHICQYGYYF